MIKKLYFKIEIYQKKGGRDYNNRNLLKLKNPFMNKMRFTIYIIINT